MPNSNGKNTSVKKERTKFFDEWIQKDNHATKNISDSINSFFSSFEERKIRYSEDAIIKLLMEMDGRFVLELGCGAGEHTSLAMSIREDIHLITTDVSLSCIKKARERVSSNPDIKGKISFVLCDVENLPFKDQSFASAMAIMVLHHVPNIQQTLQQVKRVVFQRKKVLFVEITSDNPFLNFSRKIFKFMPKYFKNSIKIDLISVDNQIPSINMFGHEFIRREILSAGFDILHEEKHNLFIFSIFYVTRIFPWMNHLFSEGVLTKIYSLEKYLLQRTFLKKFGGAAVLWTIRK